MRLANPLLTGLVLCSGVASSLGANSIRAVMLSGLDPVPGIPGARFSSVPGGQVILDNSGRAAFATATVTPGSSGVWSEAVQGLEGTLTPVAIEGGEVPGVSGAAFGPLSNARLVGSDNGRVAFVHTLPIALSPVGLWMHDGPNLALLAYTGRTSPTSPSGVWNLNYLIWPPSMTLDGNAAFVTGFTAAGSTYLATFWGTPAANTMCARTELGSSAPGFTSFSTPQMNSLHAFSVPAAYRSAGVTRSGIFTGPCAGMDTTVIQQQVIPAYIGLPDGSTFTSPTNLGLSDDLVTFVTTISGAGVTSSTDTAIWSYRSGGYTLVAREGAQVPGLPAGCFYSDFKNGLLTGPIASASGQLAWAGNIYGPGVAANNYRVVMQQGSDGVVRVVARLGDQPPEYPAGASMQTFGSGLAMNSNGQLCFSATISGQPGDRGASVILATDLSQQLRVLFESGQSHTVRPGVTAIVNAPTTEPLVSGQTDGLPRNWNSRGEFAFRAGYSIPGGSSGYGLFVVGFPGCAADFNKDGFLDFSDFDDFVGAFEAGTPAADFNGDGFLDFSDFDDFVGAFETGC